jgi:hypothetical protein
MLMMRPQLRFHLREHGLIAWKFDEIDCNHRVPPLVRKFSTGAMCWMPALLTRMSTAPSSA